MVIFVNVIYNVPFVNRRWHSIFTWWRWRVISVIILRRLYGRRTVFRGRWRWWWRVLRLGGLGTVCSNYRCSWWIRLRRGLWPVTWNGWRRVRLGRGRMRTRSRWHVRIRRLMRRRWSIARGRWWNIWLRRGWCNIIWSGWRSIWLLMHVHGRSWTRHDRTRRCLTNLRVPTMKKTWLIILSRCRLL